jgi:hypothetical protein
LLLDGISKATDNMIRELILNGGLMAKKMTLMSTLKCKTPDGKVVHYFVYHRGGGFEIVGPNLERHRCHPSVKNAKDAQIEIAKVYGVEVIP